MIRHVINHHFVKKWRKEHALISLPCSAYLIIFSLSILRLWYLIIFVHEDKNHLVWFFKTINCDTWFCVYMQINIKEENFKKFQSMCFHSITFIEIKLMHQIFSPIIYMLQSENCINYYWIQSCWLILNLCSLYTNFIVWYLILNSSSLIQIL